MTDQDGNQSRQTVTFDFTVRESIERFGPDVQRILDEQLPGYVLALDFARFRPQAIEIPVDDLSPPWEVLWDHYAAIAERDGSRDDDAALEQTTIDDESELRLFPVRLANQHEDVEPVPVIISWRDHKVVGFTGAAPEARYEHYR